MAAPSRPHSQMNGTSKRSCTIDIATPNQNSERSKPNALNNVELTRPGTLKTQAAARSWTTGVAISHLEPNASVTVGAATAEIPMLAGNAMTRVEAVMRKKVSATSTLV